MTWKEVLDSTEKTVTVLSCGHNIQSVSGQHFEQFSKKREFSFEILRFGENEGRLYHPWLVLVEDAAALTYELRSDGTIVLDDPSMYCII